MIEDLKLHMDGFFKKNIRFDGRKFDEYRDISVETNISKSAEGSARVKIGDTEVIVGVKLELGKPYPDSPDEGTIMVGAELLPMSNPEFESGPPSIGAVELARVVDRGIRESKVLDFKKLCIEKGEKIWIVAIDIITINVDGNLFDASALAAMVALKNAKFPKIEDDKVNYKELTKESLPLSKKDPVSVTVCKIGDTYLIDPTTEEEKVVDARLTVATTKEGKICAMQKGEVEPLSINDIDKMVELASKKCDEMRKHIK
ncbi:RNA-binding protein [Candidatus Woesearchaeota archaeon B3_Woes]|nr:MAG: RNA-binding protein [Candidatus Woesearchaeota archaeon B3_Woes]